MARTEGDTERSSLGFSEAVHSAFKFLTDDFSFACVRREATFVRYESSNAFVNIYHGRASFEMNVEIGKLKGTGDLEDFPFTIGEILNVASPQEAETYHPFQGTSAESVKTFTTRLAELVQKHATLALRGDLEFFRKVSNERGKRSDALVLAWELSRARRDAEKAWREKQFERVASIYEPVKQHLTASETKKLEYAKKQADSR